MRLVVAACLAGLWLGACSGDDDAGDREPECAEPLLRCGETCVDPAGDPAHCGGCGLACEDGLACLEGACVALRCDEGLTACGGACVDLGSDPAHCGRCGVACLEGQACDGGACACPEGRQLCDGVCVDTGSDRHHCGGCGEVCEGADRCLDGACLPAACEGTLLLPGPSETALGGPVRDAVLADWDGDGDLDLIAALVEPPGVRVFANRGDGTFTSLGAVPGVPGGLNRAGDLDADGDVDVLAVDPVRPDVLVLARRENDGSFAQASVQAGAAITDILLADLDGEAPPELVVATADTIRIHWGGTGESSVAVSASSPAHLRVGDLDGDGDVDVAAIEGDSVRLVLLQGTSGIETSQAPLGADPGELELGDLDGDGDLDVVASSGVLLRNRGDGTFDRWPAELPRAPGLEVGDVNGDGRLDLLFVGGDVALFLGGPDGFRPAGARLLPPGIGWTAVAAFDGDATLDLLAIDEAGGSAALLPGHGDGTFPSRLRTAFHTGRGPRIAIANVVGGGAADLLLGFRSDPEIRVYRASRWGLVYTAATDVGHGVEDLVLGDVDGDGYRDLFAADRAGHEVTLSRSRPDGGFEAPVRMPVGAGPIRLALADVDEDGWRDLAVLEADARSLRVLRNNLWTDVEVIGLEVTPLDLASGDTDGDGVPEFAIAGVEGVQTVRRDGQGRLFARPAFEPAASAIASGDLDRDGRDEVLTLGAAGLAVYRDAGGSLEPAGSYFVDGGVALGLADLDLDGRQDVLVLAEDGRVELFRGDGAARLAPAGRWAALGAPLGADEAADLAFLDADRDGWLEPIVAAEGEQGYLIPGCRPAP